GRVVSFASSRVPLSTPAERPPPECPQSWSTIHDYEIHGSTWWTIWVRFVQLVHLVENRVQRIAATAHARDPAAGTCDALTRGATPGAARPPHRGNTAPRQRRIVVVAVVASPATPVSVEGVALTIRRSRPSEVSLRLATALNLILSVLLWLAATVSRALPT